MQALADLTQDTDTLESLDFDPWDSECESEHPQGVTCSGKVTHWSFHEACGTPPKRICSNAARMDAKIINSWWLNCKYCLLRGKTVRCGDCWHIEPFTN